MRIMPGIMCAMLLLLTTCSNGNELALLQNWQKSTSSPLLLTHNKSIAAALQKPECVPGKVLRTELGSYYLPSTFTKINTYPLIVLLYPMLFANLEISPGRRLFTAFATGYGGSGFLMHNFQSLNYIPQEFKIPGFLF